MSELRRTDPLASSDPSADPVVRAQIELLLIEGLDGYFAGRYEEAVHVWTRVLFLDRSHAKARAYIDRARTAMAERQRQSEELLHASQDLLDRGQPGAARNLLTEAVQVAGDDERASALRVRLERLERSLAASKRVEPREDASRPAARESRARAGLWPTWTRRVAVLGLVAAGLVLLTLTATDSILPRWVGFTSAEIAVPRTVPAPLPVLSSPEVSLIRARTLYGRGRLAEALQALDHVASDSAFRPEADRLRAEIQRLLLAAMPVRNAPIPGETR
jgi:hypothetical protein